MKLRQDFLFVVTFLAPILSAALTFGAQSARAENVATFPDMLDGRKVLAVDLHAHTVFSDGRVWPNVRVDEALREGLSGFAFTDHEDCPPAVPAACPHRKDFPVSDHNRPYEIGKEYLATKNNQSLVLINGMEITRDNPPGHVNAVFVTDANALMKTDPVEAYMAAKAQGAFLTWNHPTFPRFAPDGLFHVTPMMEKLIADGLIQGIEVANGPYWVARRCAAICAGPSSYSDRHVRYAPPGGDGSRTGHPGLFRCQQRWDRSSHRDPRPR